MPVQGVVSTNLDEIRIVIRSILTSFKQGCPVNELLRDYFETCGKSLPFRQLGYQSATDLLTDLPDVARFQTNRDGQPVVFAVSTADTRHVADLVRRQKTASKGKKRPLSLGRSFSASRRPPLRQSSYGRPANHSRSWSNDSRMSHPPPDFFRKNFYNGPSTVRLRAPAPLPPRFSRQIDSQAASAAIVRPSSINGDVKQDFLNKSQEIKRRLENLAMECSLDSPIYKSVPICKGKAFMCSVKVGPHSAGSIVEFSSSDEAECAAATNAVNLLTKYYQTSSESKNDSFQTKNGEKSASVDEETSNFEEILENILLILEKHPNGIVHCSLMQKYVEQYHKNLPTDWLGQLEENAPEISLNRIDDFRSIVAKNIVKSPRAIPIHPFLLAPKSPSSFDSLRINDDDEQQQPSTAQIFTNIIGIDDKFLRKSIDSVDEQIRNGHGSDSQATRRLSVDSQVGVSATVVRRSVVFNEEKNSILEFHRPDAERREMFDDPSPIFARAPEPLSFPEGEAYWDIHVHMVFSPAEFLFRLKDYDHNFYDLRMSMEEYYKKNEADPIESESDFKNDRPLFACEAEDTWHRVSLIEILVDQRKAEVLFIDFGDRDIVDFANLRQLEPEFVGFPAQAVRACLIGFERWTYDDFDESVIDRFRRLVFDKDLTCQRCLKKENDSQADLLQQEPISLIVYAKQDDDSQGSDETVVLVNEIIEKLIPDDKYEALESDAQADEALESDAQVGEALASDAQVNQLIAIDPQVDNAMSAAFFSPDINQNDRDSHYNQVSTYVEDAADIPAFADFDSDMEILVVFAADPSEFSIQPTSHVEKLESLMKDLKDFYSTMEPEHQSRLHPGQVKSGGFYAAMVDGGWFRVFCCDDKCPQAVSIFLIDYGEFYVCPTAMIRRLPYEFRQLPMLSVQCSLAGIKPYHKFSHSYDADCSIIFGEKVTGRRYLARIRSRSVKKSYNKPALPYLDLDLIDLSDGGDRSVSDWLIEKKFAAKV